MIDTQAMAANTDYAKNLNHTVRHSNAGTQKFELNNHGPLSTKNEKGETRAQILEKLKQPVAPRSAAKSKEQEPEESDVVLPVADS
jgi:hypothetical protein